ncbi:Cytokinin dehydrogenase 2 [Glycine soja]
MGMTHSILSVCYVGSFQVKWLRLLYNNFTAFSIDQEHLISFSERNDITTADYVEGILLSNQPPLDLLFFPASDHQREVAYLLKGLNFVTTFVFEKDASYEEFVNRVYPLEQMLRSEGLWEVPHPWLNLWVPRSRMSDFDKVVFNDIVLKQNITGRSFLVYPTNRRNKWDDRMTPVTPDEMFSTLLKTNKYYSFARMLVLRSRNI